MWELSYKSKKLVSKPKEDWIRVEGTHEPIISREIWDTVVAIDQKKVRKSDTADGVRSIFILFFGRGRERGAEWRFFAKQKILLVP